MVYGWGSERFLKYFTLYEMKGVGQVFGVGPPNQGFRNFEIRIGPVEFQPIGYVINK